MKRILAMILCLLMVIPLLFSCAKEEVVEEETVGETVDETIPVVVEDLGEKEFKILSVSTALDYGVNSIVVEDSSSVLNQAILTRNLMVSDRLNCTFSVEELTNQKEMVEEIKTIGMAGELVYDMYYFPMLYAMPLVVEGLFAESAQLDVVDFSKEWWDQNAISDTKIQGKMYSLIGSANLQFYESIYMMAYNVNIANEVGIPNLAQKALGGDWTWEQMYEYSVQGYVDDGPTGANSQKDENDRFGLTTNTYFITNAIFACGENILEYDANNYPSFTGFNNRTIDIYDDICAWFFNSNSTFIGARDNTIFSDSSKSFHDIFISGNALFYNEPIGSLQKLRDCKFDYTILPQPKYEKEDDYYTVVGMGAYGMFVPSLTKDLRPIGIMLDNLNYQSHVDVIPAYTEEIVSLQRTRNADSYEVLNEIIFKSETVVSLLTMYDWGGLWTELRTYATDGGRKIGSLGYSMSRTLPSLIEKSLGPKQ